MKLASMVLALTCIVTASASAQTVGCVKPGVFTTKARGDMRAAFNRIQVDSIFNGVQLTAEDRARAEAIVDEAKVSSPGVAPRGDARHQRVMQNRNDKLSTLLSSAADRQRVQQNLVAMETSPQRCDVAGG